MIKDLFKIGPVFQYIRKLFTKSGKGENTNLRIMNGINKISIVMFGIALLVMLYRWLFR